MSDVNSTRNTHGLPGLQEGPELVSDESTLPPPPEQFYDQCDGAMRRAYDQVGGRLPILAIHCVEAIICGLFGIASAMERASPPPSTHTSDGSPESTESTAGETYERYKEQVRGVLGPDVRFTDEEKRQ
jgi:hypothetical protein